MVAITGVHVIEGKPSASSALISALVRRAGHKLRVKGDAVRAVAQVIRADDPEYAFEVAFTLDDAERAGLLGKKVWKQYPASMLKARAISAVARDACEEALFGIHYTPEELGAEVDGDGEPIEAGFVRQAPGQDAWATATPAPAAPAQQPQAAAEPWDAAAEGDLSGGRDWINEATEAPDVAAVRAVWQEAKAAGCTPERLAEIAAVGRGKAVAEESAPQPAEQPPAAEPVAATLPGAPASGTDRLGAVAQLYAAAHAAGMSEVEARQVLAQETGGKTTATATGDEIAAVTAALREAAGGAQ
jgi:hypothetical protein